jgi:sugar phosphate isomerase/epimerase
MLRVGLNPYGLTYWLGLQGSGTERANPDGRGLEGEIEIAQEIGARSIELHNAWLATMPDDELATLRGRLEAMDLQPVISFGLASEPVDSPVRSAVALGARVIRTPLSSVLCGDRAAQGQRWPTIVADARTGLAELARVAAAAGLTVGVENHQDFGSRELLAFCEDAGPNVGITLDVGNALAVGEDSLDFAERVAHRVVHVHLKDYRAQFTDEGYRLVRCAIGDGAVPFADVAALLGEHHESLTASLEPGALEFRHIRLLTPTWWNGYPDRSATELALCLAAARRHRHGEGDDVRTPWERGDEGATLVDYELDMIRRSASTMKSIGLMTQGASA